MPLPGNGLSWPPVQLKTITPALNEWSAWYEGTPEALTNVYVNYQRDIMHPDRHPGGLRGVIQRMWWGRQPAQPAERPDQSHLPIAADLARASADLLYSEVPMVRVESPATQAHIDESLPAIHAALATGAELGAALGGRYHRVTWDATVSKRSFLTTVDADAALPEFRWGRLVAVTFWHRIAGDNAGTQVWRHLERHELSPDGLGLIFHGLYQGTADNLGVARPLEDQPETKGLVGGVDEEGALTEGRTPGLAVEYIPNQMPQRRWRKDPVGRHLGRSDYDGIEPLMDNLDEAFSSLMRDIRIGKGRIIVPEFMLRSNGPGAGTTFDIDRTVYDALSIPDPESGAPQILPQQFAIRVEEHLAACQEITRQIVHTAGYSSQTFSDNVDAAGAMTATEVRARERRTFRTRDRKVRNETPAVSRLLEKMLSIDSKVFEVTGLDLSKPITIEFPDNTEDPPLVMAQTAQALSVARAASIETLVKMQHPDWTDEQVKDERQAIIDDQGTVADPFALR
jgi:A118 family predicted phage portal protein